MVTSRHYLTLQFVHLPRDKRMKQGPICMEFWQGI